MPMRLMVLVLLGLVGGCKLTYTISMRPKDDGFVRSIQRLDLREQKGPDGKKKMVKDYKFPAGESENLEKIYGVAAVGDPPTFRGTFANKTPQDVGGAGSWVRWHSTLGTATTYVERFGGDIELHKDFKEANQAVDHAVDLLIDWFGRELADEPRWPKLKKFLDENLRTDAKDLVVLLWLSRSMDNAEEEMTVRIGQQLIERGYTTAKRLPADVAAVQDDRGLGVLLRLVARRMGVENDRPIPESLAFLKTRESLETSFERWYADSAHRRKQLAEWEEKKKNNPGLKKPTEPDFDLDPLIGRGFLGKPRHVSVTVQSPEKPYATNGQWDDRARRTRWDRRYDGKNRLPTLIYASWSVPNERAQKKIFGRVALEAQALGRYILALQGMSPPDRQRFEAYLEGLKPDDRLERLIGEYKNPDGKKPPVVDLLLSALKKGR